MDYLAHLPEQLSTQLPDIPIDELGQPVADPEDILDSVAQGDVLVIIASDEVDPRAAKLSQTLLSDNLVKQWDLALIDVALYRPSDALQSYIVVPHLRNLIQSEPRQVVRVVVEGETPSARIEVERITPDEITTGRQKWDESRFFRQLEVETVPRAIQDLALQLTDIARHYPNSLSLSWGTGKNGSMVLKRHNGGLIELFASGDIRFRPHKFERALGEKQAEEYRRALEGLAPASMSMSYPRLTVDQADKAAPALINLIQRTLERIESSNG